MPFNEKEKGVFLNETSSGGIKRARVVPAECEV
jgi:hypothetical protein